MIVTFISKCEKKSLNKTRRVLDAFANRIGDRAWQTPITEEGLQAVKKLLKKTATKNTAVACHKIKSRKLTKLEWIVGNRDKFNFEGHVAVNFTDKHGVINMDENKWQTKNIIYYATAIAALFHDFGKASYLFQGKLDSDLNPEINKNEMKNYEPYRHEWVSLRLFQSFVHGKEDKHWLENLSMINHGDIESYFKDGIDEGSNHPLENLKPFAQFVAWLILTHHKLPIYPKWKEGYNNQPNLKYITNWFLKNFDVSWNSHNCNDIELKHLVKQNWKFKELPTKSINWIHTIRKLADNSLKNLHLINENKYWLNDNIFTLHISRMCLMLADHYFSSQNKTVSKWRDKNYQVYANTKRKKDPKQKPQLKQQLDEHLIGVAYHGKKIVTALPNLNSSLNQLTNKQAIKFLNDNVDKKFEQEFGWQNKAKREVKKISKETIENGFFGINMASTGKGKTIANAKIMYALTKKTGRIRFNVALGLRTLTLQTGKEFKNMLKLKDEDIAIAVGGIAVKQLFENEQKQVNQNQLNTGSESEEKILDTDYLIHYKGEIKKHSLRDWTKHDERIDQLLQAPVLVSTIDHLIPATEGTKGGKQIAPMLRLLTSDLILDEPDDFGLNDLPALCRLVNWAGMLGSRVLLSTATMPPALSYALFIAYKDGWQQYAKANIANWNKQIACAWFDENNSKTELIKSKDDYIKIHNKYVNRRIKYLDSRVKNNKIGKIAQIEKIENVSVISIMAKTIQDNIQTLHTNHWHNNSSQNNKRITVGLVRMANINQLVAIAKDLIDLKVTEDTCIHYCVYHSRYPLAIRNSIETKLDRILNRKNKQVIWQHPEIKQTLQNHKQANHIFVVLASPVAEVGRDHDYDWAIIEPSSMRSIIQIAGRVIRHRKFDDIKQPNIVLLNQNYKALNKKTPCFVRPGFESSDLQIAEHRLNKILKQAEFQHINAKPRIAMPEIFDKNDDGKYLNLVELEHMALLEELFNEEFGAKLWWQENNPKWCGEMQRQQRFRDSNKDEAIYLIINDGNANINWQQKNENVYPPKLGELSGIQIDDSIELNNIQQCNLFWFNQGAKEIYQQLSKELKIDDLKEFSQKFGEVRLIQYNKKTQEQYSYHKNLGLYQEIGEEKDD